MKLPRAKSENTVVQHLKDEMLIYNLKTNQAFCLNSTAGKVFNACNGEQTFEDLKIQYKFTDDLIYLTLEELKRNYLLEHHQSSHFGELTRREVIKKVGLMSMIALPVITGLLAPQAAHAASSVRADNGTTCTIQNPYNSTECKSGNCTSTFASTYDPSSGGSSVSSGGVKCCAGLSNTTGSYTNGGDSPGYCDFFNSCCLGTGTEAYDANHEVYYCICSPTS